MATKVDGWLRKFHYSLDEDFLPYVINSVRAQVPRALKVLYVRFYACGIEYDV